jgi:two-component system OmpR family response regulator
MKLLIVEDDHQMAYTLRDMLRHEYVVDLAFTGEEGLIKAEENEYDLFIIDYVLPGIDGVEVVRTLRKNGISSLILFLTGRVAADDKVLAFDTGADDYVTKPYSAPELRARIRALLRRYPQRISTNILQVGDLTIDLSAKSVRRNKKTITLRRKEFDLLEYFVRNAGKIITRSMILDHVWDSSYESFTNTIDVHINYLRQQVDKPFKKKLIKTVHGVGYRLEV